MRNMVGSAFTRWLSVPPGRAASVAIFLDVEHTHLFVPRHRAVHGKSVDVTDEAVETGLKIRRAIRHKWMYTEDSPRIGRATLVWVGSRGKGVAMRINHLITILVLLAVGLLPSPAQAGGVVTVCDEAHLLAALAGGGTVTFACSGVITLTNTIMIAADTTIDGSGQDVTISGNDAVRVLAVNSGVTFNLNALTIAHGAVGDYEAGGGISMRDGTLTVSNSTFAGNSAHGGGGIYKAGGAATLTNSTFSGNYASQYVTSASTGGGILNDGGTLDVSDCVFSGNGAYGGAGAIDNRGALTVSASTFSGNYASSGRSTGGGGIGNGGMATVSNSTFSGNSASGTYSAAGGGIYNYGTLSVSNSTFSDNRASAYWGGGGGGIENDGGRLAVSNSTFSGNSATSNELVGSIGGGIRNVDGTLTVSNSSLSGNSATYGSGIWNSGTATLTNTIVADNRPGENCRGNPISDGGGNLSYPDTTCPGTNADPLLGPLQMNGGPTLTMDPGPGSAAIDAGDDAICAAAPVNNLDQRGFTRPVGAHCDIGAVEVNYLPWRKWLPIMFAQ